MSMLDRKLARELYGSKGLLLAITSIVAVGMTCFVSMRSAYYNLQQAKIELLPRSAGWRTSGLT